MTLRPKLSSGSWQRQGWHAWGAWRVSAGRVCGLAACFPPLPGEECDVFAFLGLWLQPHSCAGSQRGAACCSCPPATCFQLHIKGVFGV